MNCLITGCSGLIGPHLAEHLLQNQANVWGTYSQAAIPHSLANRMGWLQCDMSNADDVDRIVDACQPDRIVHLAAQSYPVKSWKDPVGTMQVNLLGTLHLLEAVRQRHRVCQVLVFGSSAEYGNVSATKDALPETAALEPDSPYGASKVAADLLSDVYARAYGLNVIRVRPFFVIGPGRGSNVFVDFAKRIVECERGVTDGLGVGNLAAVRDLVDVRDAVRAIWTIAEKGSAGTVYNLCSGRAHSIAEALDTMLKFASTPVRVYIDQARFRPLDTPRLVGDSARLRQLGWMPEIPLELTLRDILQFWRVEFRESSECADAVQNRQ
jgi:GDP-4-dehydro-6-deoxy-D-mannose reductase